MERTQITERNQEIPQLFSLRALGEHPTPLIGLLYVCFNTESIMNQKSWVLNTLK